MHKNKKKKITPADSNAKEVPSYLYVVKINDPDFKWTVYRGPFYSKEEALKWSENSPYQTQTWPLFYPAGEYTNPLL